MKAKHLTPMVSNSKLQAELQSAIAAHGIWKQKLRTAIKSGSTTLKIGDVARDDVCHFGQWLHNGIPPKMRKQEHYEQVLKLHAQVHEVAATVLSRARGGDIIGALSLMDNDFNSRSKELVRAISTWRRTLN